MIFSLNLLIPILVFWGFETTFGELQSCIANLESLASHLVDNAPMDIITDGGQTQQYVASEYLNLLVDSSSRVYADAESAITAVNPGNIGNFDECEQIPATTLCLAGSRSLHTKFDAPSPFAGICLPSSCTESDLEDVQLKEFVSLTLNQKLMPHLSEILQGYPTSWNSTVISASAKASYAVTSSQILTLAAGGVEFFRNLQDALIVASGRKQGFTCGDWEFSIFDDWVAITVILVFILISLKVAQDSWADLKKERSVSGRWRERLYIIPSRSPSIESLSSLSDGTIPPSPSSESFDKLHKSKSKFSFSAIKNIMRLFTVKDRNPGLGTFDGLRVISILWVMLGHCIAIQASVGYINPWSLLPPGGMLGQWVGQFFFSARYAVDTFFFMSGFLVVYVMLRRFETQAQEQNVPRARQSLLSWLPFFYIHRYLRIVPLYTFVLLIWWKVAIYIGNGPFWFRWLGYVELCDNLWFTNLLFVNNLVPWGVCETCGCLYVSWYLANDMQFYILSPIFFVIYYYRNLTGMTLTLLVCGALVLFSVQETIEGEWSDFTFDGAAVTNFSHWGYTVPWVKAPPYLIGMWTGMFWHRREKKWPDWKFSRSHARIAMCLSFILIYGVMFCGVSAYQLRPCLVYETPEDGVCGSGWPKWGIIFHTCFSRSLWALGLSLLSITCFLGQGGIFQSILAHPAWVPFSRLTFGAYLIHPIVLNVWFFRQTEKYRYSNFDFAMTYICVVFVSFMLAVVATLVIEQPVASLVKGFEDWFQPLIKSLENHKEVEMTENLNNISQDQTPVVRRTEKTSLLDPNQHTSV